MCPYVLIRLALCYNSYSAILTQLASQWRCLIREVCYCQLHQVERAGIRSQVITLRREHANNSIDWSLQLISLCVYLFQSLGESIHLGCCSYTFSPRPIGLLLLLSNFIRNSHRLLFLIHFGVGQRWQGIFVSVVMPFSLGQDAQRCCLWWQSLQWPCLLSLVFSIDKMYSSANVASLPLFNTTEVLLFLLPNTNITLSAAEQVTCTLEPSYRTWLEWSGKFIWSRRANDRTLLANLFLCLKNICRDRSSVLGGQETEGTQVETGIAYLASDWFVASFISSLSTQAFGVIHLLLWCKHS